MAIERVGDRYRILRELGRGGMATVWLALDEKHQREVAVKVLRPDVAALAGPERFLREIELTASLNHPHILPLLDSGSEAGLVFYVMPYVPGGSLRRLLEGEALPLEAIVRIAGEVASALDHAHARGIVHRDVKPENVLFSDGLAVVSDFGIARALSEVAPARMTATGLPLGTPGYMSPEQALGAKTLDARTDVYALGSVAYEMIVGETPASWPGPDEVELGRFADLPPAHRERLDALPGRVEQVLARALALRPQHRFPSAGELAAALAAASERHTSFTDEQVRQLLRRAGELQQVGQEPAADQLTIGAVEQVAAQVGIPPLHVRQAALELELEQEPVQAGGEVTALRGGPGDWRRVRKRWNLLVSTEDVPGEVPSTVFPGMVAEIERRLKLLGHASVLGDTLTWSPVGQDTGARSIVIHVTAAEGRTRVHLLEQLRLTGWRKVAVPLGVFMGFAFATALGTAAVPPLGALIQLAGLVGGGFGGLRFAVTLQVSERGPELQRLAIALAGMARIAIERQSATSARTPPAATPASLP